MVETVAVVGSGISGLVSAYLLSQNGAKVTLFEKEERCGGHTLTTPAQPGVPELDIGFQVFNLTTYPHFVAFLEHIGVDSEPSDMSFSLCMDRGGLEWASHDLDAVFCQRSNITDPRFLRMIYEVVRFGREAPAVLQPENEEQFASVTLGEYLQSNKYSDRFVSAYVLPMCAAVWSVPNSLVLRFPVQLLVRFWVNHHLLDLTQRPVWRVVKGRSQAYVDRVLSSLPDVRTGCAVVSVSGSSGDALASGDPQGCRVTTADGRSHAFDRVVLATHSDVTAALLGDGMTPEEAEVLRSVPYSSNEVFVHTDVAFMPTRRKAWASWNLLGSSSDSQDAAVCVTYWLNRLQNLPPGTPELFATLNPPHPPAAEKVLSRHTLHHPVFGMDSFRAQEKLPSIQNVRGICFAGAWCGYGFHEDGTLAAVEAVGALGVRVPWQPRATSPKRSWMEGMWFGTFDAFCRAAITQGSMRVILPDGTERLYGQLPAEVAAVAGEEPWRGEPRPVTTLRVMRWDMFRRCCTRHDIGLGEAYMAGDFEVEDVGGLMAVAVANAGTMEGKRGLMGAANWAGDKVLRLAHAARANTLAGSRRNIEAHYDAGNAMYKVFLSPDLTYSAGIHAPGRSLHDAQLAKLDALIAAADLQPTDSVLEVGCGWGSFAIRAASTVGCRVTGLTLSKEQLAEANARVEAAGLEDRVTLLLCDYRLCPGGDASFDKVVSCEMIEAVGEAYLPSYFHTLGRMLKPGGKAVIQVIACAKERYAGYCRSSDFIREHIFPGGHLPSLDAMQDAAAASSSGLVLAACTDIGRHYAVTLRAWRAAWEAGRDAVLALGYSETFYRKYRFYFGYCEAAFDAAYIHDFHLTWEKVAPTAARPDLYATAADGALATPVVGGPVPEGGAVSLTHILLAVYFFLAGIAVTHNRYLWTVPLATAGFTALLHVIAAAPRPAAIPGTHRGRAAWALDCSECLFTVCSAATATALVAAHPEILLLRQPPPGAVPAATYLVCTATGFLGFMIFTMVANRLYTATMLSMLHHTVLVVAFSAGAYRAHDAPWMVPILLYGAVPAVEQAAQLLETAGASERAVALTRRVHTALFLPLKLVPELLSGCVVLASPSAFTGPLLACGAAMLSVYLTIRNVWKAITLYGGVQRSGEAGKQHLA